MKHRRRSPDWMAAIVRIIILNSILTSAIAVPLSGTRTIGPTGDYPSITAALADIQVQTLDGPLVLELQSTYISSVETFPLVFADNLTTTAVNTLTLRPEAGAANLLITSAAAFATVDIKGAQFVTIDGRPGGVGSYDGSGVGGLSQLTIANTTNFSASALYIEATTNSTITYTTLEGMNTLGAVVNFAFGDVSNTIDHCDIRDAASTPAYGIIGGSSCQNDIISNCNIYNYFAAASGNQIGIALNAGTGWTITGNSFYQTVPRSYPAIPSALIGAISISIFNAVTNNFAISSNSIGGSAPNAGGSPWTITGTPRNIRFIGIVLNAGSAIPTSVQGNVIKNFSWQSSLNLVTLPVVWSGISILGGSANIGTAAGNIIGDENSLNSISVATGAGVTGINSTSTNTVVIANNVITSMQMIGSTPSAAAPFLSAISVTNGVSIISNNVVGSSNVLSALTATTSATVGPAITGISSYTSNSAVIIGNMVGGFNNQFTGLGGGSVRGIWAFGGINTVTGNTVRNLTTSTQLGAAGSDSSGLGIEVSSPLPGQTVSQNTVYSIANTSSSGSTCVTGIEVANYAGGGGGIVAQNLVHSLEVVSTDFLTEIDGFSIAGAFTVENNMARVGIGANGANTASGGRVFGMVDRNSNPGRNFFHNSVYVGGTQTSGRFFSCAFVSTGSGNARTLKNNIFVNARDSGGGTNSHYAVYHTDPNLTGLASDGNLLVASGVGGVLVEFNTNGYQTLAAWQVASGQDGTSLVTDPLFINPTGDLTTVDLHISSGSPAIGAGLSIGVATDFDGGPRHTIPTIGADELFDYTLVPGYNLLTSQWLGGGTNAIGFHGLPGSNYALEMATNLTPPVFWLPLVTNNAGTNGSLSFTNVTSQSPVFFRTRSVP